MYISPESKIGFVIRTSLDSHKASHSDYRFGRAEISILAYEQMADGRISETEIAEISYLTHVYREEDKDFDCKQTNLRPRGYDDGDRPYLQFVQWYGEGIKIKECNMSSFAQCAKLIQSIITKLDKVKEKYNLPYRFHDPLECLCNALRMAGYMQLRYSNACRQYKIIDSKEFERADL